MKYRILNVKPVGSRGLKPGSHREDCERVSRSLSGGLRQGKIMNLK